MDHAYFTDRLSALFDNELPLQEKQVVEEHVHGCAECQAALAKLKQLEDAVTRHSQLSDTDYWEKSAQKIEQRLGFEQQTVITPIRRKWYEKGLGWKAVAAAASIAVLAYIGINSDKILKQEDLEPSKMLQAPSRTPAVPRREIVADSAAVGRPQDVVNAAKDEEAKGIIDGRDQLDIGGKEAAPVLKRTPPSAPQDINLSEQISVDTAEEYLPPAEKKEHTDQLLRSRVAPAPASKDVNVEMVRETTELGKQVVLSPKAAVIPEASRIATPSALSAESSRSMPIPDTAAQLVEQEADNMVMMLRDTAQVDSTLTWWRKKRDALETVRKTLPGVDAFGGISRMAAPSKLKSSEPPSPQLTPDEVEKQLLEAWYNIAKLTSDKAEREEAVAGIRKVADGRRSPNRSFAVRYMQELGER